VIDEYKPKVGLVLGSGSARGWAHIGVIRALQDAGIEPDIVCGTSIGSLVGAAYAADKLDDLEVWVKSLTWKTVVGLLDFTITAGLIKGIRLIDFFRAHFADIEIPQLAKPFACVATELGTGREVWLREGLVLDAIRASIALPGLFTPIHRDNRLLVDGGLVNPVPVSLARAMGAEIVIAVDLSSDMMGRRLRKPLPAAKTPRKTSKVASHLSTMLAKLPIGSRKASEEAKAPQPIPSMLDVMASSINIMQERISRSRLAGEPAEVMIRPRLGQMALMDFHRATPAIVEGRRAAEAAMPQLLYMLNGGDVRIEPPPEPDGMA
jgi:NTE family protein